MPCVGKNGKYLLFSRVDQHLRVPLSQPFSVSPAHPTSTFCGLLDAVVSVRRSRLTRGLSSCISAGFVGDKLSLR